MKKIFLLLIAGVLVLNQSFSLDFSVLTGGTKNEGRIGFNLFKLINMNVGVDYRASDYSYTYSGTSYTYSVEHAFLFAGVKVLVPVSLAKQINLYAGADMYSYNPRVFNSRGQNYYDAYYDNLKIEGMRYYLNCEYYPDPDKSFAFTGSYGIDELAYNYSGVGTYQRKSTSRNSFAQIGFIFYL